MRLLIIKPSSLGDVIHGLPALALIRQRLGTELERVSWVVNESFRGVLELAPGIDRIVEFPRKTLWQRGVIPAFLRELRSEPYDVAVDFQGLLRSGLIARASRAPRRVGFADGRECSPWFYTERIAVPKGHAVLKNLQLADAAFPASDGKPHPDYPAEPLLVPREEHIQSARNALGISEHAADDASQRPILAVGHSSRWPSKSWPVKFFAAVIDRVVRERPDTVIWLLGSPAEQERAEAVRTACTEAQPLNLSGKTDMTTLVALLYRSDALLTNDSGPMHIAAAVGTPCVALFGATNPTLTGPYGPSGRHTVFTSGCPKAPCFQHVCPFHEDDRCAREKSPEEIAQAVIQSFQRKEHTIS